MVLNNYVSFIFWKFKFQILLEIACLKQATQNRKKLKKLIMFDFFKFIFNALHSECMPKVILKVAIDFTMFEFFEIHIKV